MYLLFINNKVSLKKAYLFISSYQHDINGFIKSLSTDSLLQTLKYVCNETCMKNSIKMK